MKKSKLLKYLSTFDKEDLKAFKKFVASPYFNNKQEIISLFAILEKCYPEFKEELVEKKLIYNHLFPNTDFDEKLLGYLMSDLCRLIERYFQVRKYEADTFLNQSHILEALLERKLNKLFQQQFTKVSENMAQLEVRDAKYYLNKHRIYDTAVEFHIAQQSRQYDENHQAAAHNLDNFYITQKLRYGCSILNNRKILPKEYQMQYLKDIQRFVEDRGEDTEPCIEIFYLASKMLENEENLQYFSFLKEFIKKQIHKIHPDDARYIYLSVINYSARRIREGKRHFAEEALNFYLHGIDNNILLEDGFLSPWYYKNIIYLGLNIRSFDWVEQFIQDYNEKLSPEFRENALHFNLANLYYHQKNYDQSIDHLNKIQFTDLSYNLGTKVLLMKIYYELNEDDPLLSLIASFTLFLKRNKNLSTPNKQSYLNFCSILNKIMRRNPKKLALIKNEIQTEKFLTERGWLNKIVQGWEKN